MKKALLIFIALALLLVPAVGCAADEPAATPAPTPEPAPAEPAPAEPAPLPAPVPEGDLDNVTLRLWGGEMCQDLLRSQADAFIAHVADRVNLTIEIGVESEETLRDTVLTDPLAAADVFAFADDQINDLYRAGVLQENVLNAAEVVAANTAGSVASASVGGRLMAWPLSPGNGYFLFYNTDYFTPEDVLSWDRMLEVAAEAGRMVSMELPSGWWNISFFRGAGFDAWEGDAGNSMIDINGPGGTDVLQGMLDIAGHPAFISLGGGEIGGAVADGSVIAAVNGQWNVGTFSDEWGDSIATTKLPTFTVAGNQVQQGGVIGSTLIGVNAFGEWAGWAMMLADWLTNENSQIERFHVRSMGPSNLAAATALAGDLQNDLAASAFAAQAPYSWSILPGGSFWDPMGTLGEIIVQGNPEGHDLQYLLDSTVEAITG